MKYRTHAVKGLTVLGALVLMAGCGSGSGSGSPSSSASGSAGAPVHGGNLVFAAVQDAQSMNATTVFDNNSIWILEQIMQPLYTVTNDGKGVMPWLATGYKVSANKKIYTFTLRPGVKFSNGKLMTSADVKFSIDQNRKAAQGLGLPRHGHQVGARPLAGDRGDQPQVPLGAAARRPVAVRQRDRPEQLRRPDREPRSTRTRSAPARSSGTTGTRARRSSWSVTRTTGSRASPT